MGEPAARAQAAVDAELLLALPAAPAYDGSIAAQCWVDTVAITPLDVGAAFTGATSFSATGLPDGNCRSTSTPASSPGRPPPSRRRPTSPSPTGTGPGGSTDAVFSATVTFAPSLITFVNAITAASAGIGVIPGGTYAVGDLLTYFSHQTTDGTNIPAPPAGNNWLQATPSADMEVSGVGGNTASAWAYKFAVGLSEVTGAWTNGGASSAVGFMRGVHTTVPFLAVQVHGVSNGNLEIPALDYSNPRAHVIVSIRTQNDVVAAILAAHTAGAFPGFNLRANVTRRVFMEGPMASFAGLVVPITGIRRCSAEAIALNSA